MPDLDLIRAFLDPEHLERASEIAAVAKTRIAQLPAPTNDDEGRLQARQVLVILGDSGLLRHAVADGEQLDLRTLCLMRESVAAASTLADAVLALQGLGSMPLCLAGDESLRNAWLPRVASGEAMAGFAMTEPNAGSDVGHLETRAFRDGDDYVLEGCKTLISNAGIADFYCVFASTDPEATSRGLSCFLVPAETEGLVFAGAQIMSEPHPLGELRFEACRVPASHRLGAEGDGFKVGMRTLDALRPTVAAAACGMAERALDEAFVHVQERRQFGRPLADFQLVQAKLAAAATELAASRLLVYRAAWEKDRGADRITLEAAMAKAFATEAAQRIIDSCQQLLGGRGVLAESVVDRLYRAVRALRIYEGTTEIQHLVIARQLLRARE